MRRSRLEHEDFLVKNTIRAIAWDPIVVSWDDKLDAVQNLLNNNREMDIIAAIESNRSNAQALLAKETLDTLVSMLKNRAKFHKKIILNFAHEIHGTKAIKPTHLKEITDRLEFFGNTVINYHIYEVHGRDKIEKELTKSCGRKVTMKIVQPYQRLVQRSKETYAGDYIYFSETVLPLVELFLDE